MVVSKAAIRRTVVASVATAAFAFGPLFTAIAQAVSLTGAGATFPVPLYDRYIAEMQKKFPDMRVTYEGIGSGGGIRQVIAGTVDFGGSDAAMTDAQISQVKNGVVLVPTAGGAVAVVYNLPGVSNLKLSRKVLSGIFSGQIERWNDAQIAADNPGAKLPNSPIRTVVRADSSGTTFIFTNHLSAISPYFKGRIGVNTAPRWTTNPIKGKGNPGVAAQVARTEGGIGYVEYAFAKQNNLQMAQVQNKKGQFVSPSVDAANQALSTIKFPDNFRVFVEDPSEGYPIVGMTWLMIYQNYDSAEKAAAVKRMVNWILTDGQNLNASLDYVRVPSSVAERARQVVNSSVKP